MLLIIILAALAMLVQDVLAVLLTQAEARNRGGMAAVLDSLMWLAGIATTTISVTALQGHSFAEKVWVILAVTGANVVGTLVGVAIGKRFIHEELDEENPPAEAGG